MRLRAGLIWAAVILLVLGSVVAAGFSSLLAWRDHWDGPDAGPAAFGGGVLAWCVSGFGRQVHL